MLRAVTGADIGIILEMLSVLHTESPRYALVKFDEQYLRANVAAMIEHPTFIETIDSALRGFMFGLASRSWYEDELNAHEHLLYILPEYRGGLLAARLIKDFERIARTRGCVHVHAGASTRMHDDRTLELYERLGYTRDHSGVFKRIT